MYIYKYIKLTSTLVVTVVNFVVTIWAVIEPLKIGKCIPPGFYFSKRSVA